MSHNLQAFVERRNKIIKAFRSSRTLDEQLKVFVDYEDFFSEDELGEALLNLCMGLYRESSDNEKTLSFAQRALKIFSNQKTSDEKFVALPIAISTQISGLTCFRLKRYDESLFYLNTAARLLNKWKGDSSYDQGSFRVLDILHNTEVGLFYAKKAVGTSEEAIIHLTNAMEIGEIIRKDSWKVLYSGYRQIATEYMGIKNYAEALYHCFKAFEILMMDPRHNPLEVVNCRKCLAIIFSELNGNEDLDGSLMAQVEAAFRQIESRRYADALETLTAIISLAGKTSEDQAKMIASIIKTLASMGEILWRQSMFADAKLCLGMSLRILDKQESCYAPHLLVEALMETSKVYEKMEDFETATMVLRRLLKMLEKLLQEQDLVGKVKGSLGRLLLHDGWVVEALPYLEDDVRRLKGSDVTNHELGGVYNDLGIAYMALDRPKSAIRAFEFAKDIIDVYIGPDHLQSIGVWRNLSKAYATMGSYCEAIELLEKAVEGLNRLGASAQEDLDVVIELLKQYKEKEHEAL